ncbi:hypothetical protein OS493_038043, partial [Desmophyllum pertusum]
MEVSQIAVERGIKTRLELVAFANVQKREGKTDLAEFIANHGGKAVEEALSIGWEFQESEENLRRSILSRMDLLVEAMEK